MTTAERIDQLVDTLNRQRMGDDYEPDSSPPWASVFEEWEVFELLVDTLDRAVRQPFGKDSAVILATASTMLLSLDAVQLYAALDDAGQAIGFAAAFPQQPATEGAHE
jgi:hypothetical protein